MESDLKEKDFSEVVKTVEGNDLHSLLEAASNSNFEGDDGLTKVKGEFEKVSSLFDLVKSASTDQQDMQAEESVQKEDKFDLPEATKRATDEINRNEFKEAMEKSDVEMDAEIDGNSEAVLSDNLEEDIIETDSVNNPDSIITENKTEVPNDKIQEEQTERDVNSDDLSDEKLDKSSYDKGYQAALLEFEKTIEQEKNDFLNVANLLMKVGDEYQGLVENILRKKTFMLVGNLIGRELDDDSESFGEQIENSAKALISESENLVLELNHSDLSLLQKYFTSKKNKFSLLESVELRRGEFRITSGSSGFEQVLEIENS